MKVRFLDLVRRRIKSEESHIPRLGAVPLLGAKYRSIENAADASPLEKKNETTQGKFWRVKPDEVTQVNVVDTKILSQSSVGLSYCAPNLHQYGQQLSSRMVTFDKMAEKYIQEFYAERRGWQIRKYEGAIDYTLIDRILDKILNWISSHFVRIPFLNHIKPIVIFFVSYRDKDIVQKYEDPFRRNGCVIEAKTSLRSFLRSVKRNAPPIVHYLSEPKVAPVTDNGVYIASFDYEGSKAAAERAMHWCKAAYGYRQNWREQSQSVKFYDRFYTAVLQENGVFDSYACISKKIEIAPIQFAAETVDFRIPILKASVNLQVKGTYDTTRNI